MAASSVLHFAAREAGSWLVVAATVVGGIVYFDELKGIAASTLGLTQETIATAAQKSKSAAPPQPTASGTVELRAGGHGHFETPISINGRSVDVMIDTGASLVALSYEDAERAGIFVRPADFTHRSQTANGIAKFAPVILERVSLGDITVRNVAAAVSEPGKLRTSLLGMSFLNKLSRTEMRPGMLMLHE